MFTFIAKALGLAGIAFALLATTYGLQNVLAADVQSPWVNGTPALLKLADYSNATGLPTSATGNESNNCSSQTLVWRPYKIISPINIQTKASIDACVINVPTGLATDGIAGDNRLLRSGTKIAGIVTGANYANNRVRMIPNSSTIIEYQTAQYSGYYISLIGDAYASMQTTVSSSTGMVGHKITKPPAPLLRDSRNNLLRVELSTLSTSDNGDWIVAETQSSSIVRINTKTSEVISFAPNFNYNQGWPFTQTAISADGRYAVVSSYGFNSFKLYDLNTCKPPATGTIMYLCQSRDLGAYMKTQIPTLKGGAGKIHFVTNDTFKFYSTYDYVGATNYKVGLFRLTTPGAVQSGLGYLALGDSYASGEGAYNYQTGTDIADNRCHLSALSYPYLLSSLLGAGQTKSVACSGAKIKDIAIFDFDEYNNSQPQAINKELKQFDDEIFSQFLPGYRGQINFVKNNTPAVVTMSAGGNDIGFSSIVRKCVLGTSDCYPTYEDRAEIIGTINNTYPKLVDMYKSVKQSSALDGKVYVIGYPQVAKQNSACGLNVQLSNNEIIFSNQLVSYLNTVIKMAAGHAGVAYIDAEQAFEDYKLCQATPGTAAMNGLSLSNAERLLGNIKQLSASETYHPTANGHRLLANTIADKTNGFTLAMPTEITGVPVFPAEANIDLLKNVTKANRAVRTVFYNDSLVADVAYKNTLTTIGLDASEYSLKPNTVYNVVLYSDPINLGTVVTDANGNISKQVQIPQSVEPGYHTLHISGSNIANEPVEITKIIYVANSEQDYDGDGLPNSEEKCLGVEPANVDYDKDGVDDACDGVISEPPVVFIPPVAPEPPVVVEPDPEDTEEPVEIIVVPDPPIDPIVPVPLISNVVPPTPNELLTEELPITVATPPQPVAVVAARTTANAPAGRPASASAPGNELSTDNVTQIAGISDSAIDVKVVSRGAVATPQTTQVKQSPELAVLVAGISLLVIGAMALLWRLFKK